MSEAEREVRRVRGRRNIVIQMEQGRWRSWNDRGEPSFPESFVYELLRQDGIKFERERAAGGYSIDIAFPELKIAFEVDGKQHDEPKNKERDKRKDSFLHGQGWMVLRLRWHSVRTEGGKKKVLDQYESIKNHILAAQAQRQTERLHPLPLADGGPEATEGL